MVLSIISSSPAGKYLDNLSVGTMGGTGRCGGSGGCVEDDRDVVLWMLEDAVEAVVKAEVELGVPVIGLILLLLV